MTVLQWALKYYSRRWAVIPIVPKSKEPLIKSWKQYQIQKPKYNELVKWFTQWPTANIAILTGKISNLAVIDADGPIGKESMDQLGLASTTCVKTGNGYHLYYELSDTNICNSVKKIPGIDIRAEGGYALAPPSIHSLGMEYQWTSWKPTIPRIPEQLVSLVNQQDITQKNQQGWITEAVKGLHNGNRNDTFTRLVGKLHDGRTSNSDIFTILSPHSRDCNLSDKELWSIIESVTRYKRQADTDDLWTPSSGLVDFSKYLDDKQSGKSTHFQTGFNYIDKATKGLRKGEIFTIGARTGIGKTSFAFALIRNILNKGKRVLLYTTELSRYSTLERLQSNLKTLASYDTTLFISDKGSPQTSNVRASTEKVKPDILVFDHIQHVSGRSESQRDNVSSFVRGLKDIGREFDCAVVCCSQIRRLGASMKTGIEFAPSLQDLKESGTIEEESAQVLLLNPLTDLSKNPVVLLANLAKNRYGPVTQFNLEFIPSTGEFKEL